MLAQRQDDICLLVTNQVHVSKRHNSAGAVATCMLLLQWYIYRHAGVEGSIPSPIHNRIAQLVRAQPFYAGSNPVILADEA